MRKVHLLLTIGGGTIGILVTMQGLMAAQGRNAMLYALVTPFLLFFGYAVFAGLRFSDNPQDKTHLVVFYLLQVPWISTPVVAFRAACGFHITIGLVDSKLNALFNLGSDWQFNLNRSSPWGVGVNTFALAMALLLLKREPDQIPGSTARAEPPGDKDATGE